METTLTESLETEIAEDYDLIVVGGGVAGVAAALAGRRAGLSVLLIEKSIMLGGLATLGFIAYWEPLDDGHGRRILGGLAQELLHLAIKDGTHTLPAVWRDGAWSHETTERYHARYNPHFLVMALEELLTGVGVTVRYDTLFCRPVVEDGRCTAVVVQEKAGRRAHRCRFVVDATGDAELAARAGVPCAEGRNWLTYCAYHTSLEQMRSAVEKDDIRTGIRFRSWGAKFTGEDVPPGSRQYVGTDAADITAFVMDGRRLAYDDLRATGREPVALPGMPQLRTIRHVVSPYILTDADEGRHFEDSIGATSDFRTRGPVWEIPYRCLQAPGVANLLVAGRGVGAEGGAWDVVRVIPPAVLTGEAAGLAAALAVRTGKCVTELPVATLQQSLADAGVLIHF